DEPARVSGGQQSGGGGFLLIEPERAQRRLVAEGEQAGGRLAALVGGPVPGRRHERIALLPREAGVTDATLAAPLDDVEDRARRSALGWRPLAGSQPVGLGAHRGHR